MRNEGLVLLGTPKPRSFDVVCVGEALWNLTTAGAAFSARAATLRLGPGGGAVNAALALARRGLRVGLATALGDDSFGRALADRIAAAGVDVGGVTLAAPRTGLVFLQGSGAARQVVSYRGEEQPIAVPAGWTSQALLLSGVSPVVAHGAALCKAARAARRAGTLVVVDVNARWHSWSGRDARACRTVLREADVVRCSARDLAALEVDAAWMRDALRRSAVLVESVGERARATGPFGRVERGERGAVSARPAGAGDAFTAALCAELLRKADRRESALARWERAVESARAAQAAHRPWR